MEKRIEELTTEIDQFNQIIREKENLIQQLRDETQQAVQGILTRQGGVIELKNFLKKEKLATDKE